MCLFCKIINKEIPAKLAYEDEDVLAFYDIDPSAETHVLVIPKKHIETFLDLKKEHSNILSQMLRLTQQLIKSEKIDRKYKLVINGGEYQFVPHLHWHLLGGEVKKQV